MLVKQLDKLICGMLAALVFAAFSCGISAGALVNGIYIADCTPHYAHPVTGEIEDSGGDGSSVLGQSMTESATYRQALIEVDPDGNMFATIRLKLMDNIQDPHFMVQENADSPFYDVGHDIMKEDFNNNESDFRFQIPGEGCIVRCTFYVIAMGRDVIFYIDFSNLSEGSGDFITSVEVRAPEQPEQTQPAQTQQPQQTQPDRSDEPAQTAAPSSRAESTSSKTEASSSLSSSSSSSSSSVPSAETTLDSLSDQSSAGDGSSEDTTYSIPESIDNDAEGIACFDEKGSRIDPLGGTEDDPKDDDGNGGAAAAVAIAVGSVVVVGAAGAVVFIKKRRIV